MQEKTFKNHAEYTNTMYHEKKHLATNFFKPKYSEIQINF